MISGLVVIVGRPNVGKSTLFNALTRSKTAIVSPQPGVTRDRLYGSIPYGEEESLVLVDTGGFERAVPQDQDPHAFAERIWEQTKLAVQEADLVLFLLDAKTGLHPHDRDILKFLRTQEKKVRFCINKVDSPKDEYGLWEFTKLGVTDFHHMCAAHNRGLGELKELIREDMLGMGIQTELSTETCKLALIGRPNVGKSSILNRLIGEERSLVTAAAGTTRDSIHTEFKYKNESYTLIDTAGMRRKAKVHEFVEEQSVIRSLSAIQKSDIVLLVLDAIQGLTDQDAKLINIAIERHKLVLLVVNKWDLVPNKTANTIRDYKKNLAKQLGDHAYLPVHFSSCLKNQRVHGIMERILELREQMSQSFEKEELNEALERIVNKHPPHLKGNNIMNPEFYSAAQSMGAPPTIIVRCNCARALITSYRRYMVHGFRRELGFDNVPVRLILKGKRRQVRELN